MSEERLVFPSPGRQRRGRIAGAIYLALGLLLLTAYAYSGDGFWLFGGTISTLLGLGLLGYRQQVTVNGASGRITHQQGFLVDLYRRNYPRGHFQQVEIREKLARTTRFSRISGQTWEPRLEVQYAVVLANNETLELDVTGDLNLARSWAEAVGAALRIPVMPEVQRETAKPAIAADIGGLPVWTRWLIVLLVLGALLGWIAFNLYQAEQSAGL